MTASALHITPEHAGPLHDAICRAVDQGLRIRRQPETAAFGQKIYWTIDSVSEPGADYLVMVERRRGQVFAWCECAHHSLGHQVCKHLALALSEMGLIPRTEGET